MALELPSGADFGCNRHCKTNPVDLEVSGPSFGGFGKFLAGSREEKQFPIVARGRLRVASVKIYSALTREDAAQAERTC